MQRRRAVGLRRVDVGLLREQRAHRRGVPAHDRVGDVAASARADWPSDPSESTQQRPRSFQCRDLIRHRCLR